MKALSGTLGLVVMLAAGAWAALAGAPYVTLGLVGVGILAVDLARGLADNARTGHANAESILSLARVTAHWCQQIGRRVGMIGAKSWVCPNCLQTNTVWDTECGRCDYEKRDQAYKPLPTGDV